MTEFPSPEALKQQIIISTEPPKVGEGNDKDSSEKLEKGSHRNILRTYPKENVGWMHGAQMVVSNMQGCDKARWLMYGMFRANENAVT
uniref:Phospholipase c n=1 Tax=Rosa rugosa TaxID=74645 RepID=J7FY69_ROSRU|nr:phospholipase c [Rosa rugosa]